MSLGNRVDRSILASGELSAERRDDYRGVAERKLCSQAVLLRKIQC